MSTSSAHRHPRVEKAFRQCVLDQIAIPRNIGSHDWDVRLHRFENRIRLPFVETGIPEYIEMGKQLSDVAAMTEKTNLLGGLDLVAIVFEPLSFRAVANDYQRGVLVQNSEHLGRPDHLLVTLLQPQPSDGTDPKAVGSDTQPTGRLGARDRIDCRLFYAVGNLVELARIDSALCIKIDDRRAVGNDAGGSTCQKAIDDPMTEPFPWIDTAFTTEDHRHASLQSSQSTVAVRRVKPGVDDVGIRCSDSFDQSTVGQRIQFTAFPDVDDGIPRRWSSKSRGPLRVSAITVGSNRLRSIPAASKQSCFSAPPSSSVGMIQQTRIVISLHDLSPSAMCLDHETGFASTLEFVIRNDFATGRGKQGGPWFGDQGSARRIRSNRRPRRKCTPPNVERVELAVVGTVHRALSVDRDIATAARIVLNAFGARSIDAEALIDISPSPSILDEQSSKRRIAGLRILGQAFRPT